MTLLTVGLVSAFIYPAYAQEKEKIYALMPNTSLSGVVDPYMADRASIKKAWPKTPADPAHVQVGWTEITLGNPWFIELKKGAERVGAKYGFNIDFQVADGDLQRQCSHIDTFITKKVDVIVVDPTDTLGVSACINRAVDAGIPVVTLGTVPESSARILTTITPNPYANGWNTGLYIGKSAGKDPMTAALIIGVVGNSTSESRLNGMVSGIVYDRMQEFNVPGSKEDAMLRGFNLFQQAKTSGKFEDPELKFKVVSLSEGKWTEEGGLAASENILSAHAKDINFIIADNDWMGLGALRAIRNVGATGIKVATSADGSRVALESIKKGDLLVTGTFSGEQTGVSTMEFLNDIFHKGLDASDLPMGSYFASYAITKENVDQFIDPNPENKFYKYTVVPVKSIPEIKAELKK
jgi:ribose transport system substrate-binding protein